MAVPNTIKVPVPFDYVFPGGAQCLGMEPVTDFDKRGQGDDQARDKDTGEHLWVVKVLDLDPEAGKFGGSKEVKVKIAAPVQPVPPAQEQTRQAAMPAWPSTAASLKAIPASPASARTNTTHGPAMEGRAA